MFGCVSMVRYYRQRPGGLMRCRRSLPRAERRVAVPSFLPVPVEGSEAKGHGEIVRRYQVQIDSSEVWCHDEIVLVPSKKQGTSASAGSPIDFVSAAGTVRVPQNLIS